MFCAHLLQNAMAIDEEQAVAIVSHIQVQVASPSDDNPASIRVGKYNISIPPGQVTHVWCRVPPNFNVSDSVVLFEPRPDSWSS